MKYQMIFLSRLLHTSLLKRKEKTSLAVLRTVDIRQLLPQKYWMKESMFLMHNWGFWLVGLVVVESLYKDWADY